MSSLSEKLNASINPTKESNIVKWLKSLSETDRKEVWEALRDEKHRTYTLLNIFRSEGAKFDKGIFVPFRAGVLSGTITEEQIHGTK